jgi:hypothetical protein
MAIAKGKISEEAKEVKRYYGVAPVFILGVNPSKEELEGIYKTNLDKDPEYTGTNKESGVKNIRLDFIVKADSEKCDSDMTTKVSMFLEDSKRYNRDKTKIQVIDKYGRTAWVTSEEYKNKEIPMYKNGPANLDSDYRACYVGEENLTQFIAFYLNIPSVMTYKDSKWVMSDTPEESEVRLDRIEDYFKGDVSELREAINLQPKNKIKIMFGIKTTDDGKQYQDAYTKRFLRNDASNYKSLYEDVQQSQEASAYSHTTFLFDKIKEYNVEATDLSKSDSKDLPFDDTAAQSPWGFSK